MSSESDQELSFHGTGGFVGTPHLVSGDVRETILPMSEICNLLKCSSNKTEIHIHVHVKHDQVNPDNIAKLISKKLGGVKENWI